MSIESLCCWNFIADEAQKIHDDLGQFIGGISVILALKDNNEYMWNAGQPTGMYDELPNLDDGINLYKQYPNVMGREMWEAVRVGIIEGTLGLPSFGKLPDDFVVEDKDSGDCICDITDLFMSGCPSARGQRCRSKGR